MSHIRYGVSAALSAPKTAPILLTGDICQCLRDAASLGYDAIEYHTRECASLDYAEIRRVMEQTKCRVSMIVTGRIYTEGGLSLTDPDPKVRDRARSGMLQYLDMAHQLGAGLVIGWAKGKVDHPAEQDAFFSMLTESLTSLDCAASEMGVPVVLEVINHYETNVFTTARELTSYLHHMKFQNISAHLDTYHMLLEETDIPGAIHQCKDCLGYMHFADSTRSFPGSGILDFKAIYRALQDIQYHGYYTVECFPGKDRYETASRALAYLKTMETCVS